MRGGVYRGGPIRSDRSVQAVVITLLSSFAGRLWSKMGQPGGRDIVEIEYWSVGSRALCPLPCLTQRGPFQAERDRKSTDERPKRRADSEQGDARGGDCQSEERSRL